MHSKLRNGGAKGRGGRNVSTSSSTSTTNTSTNSSSSNNTTSVSASSNTPSTSPTAFLVPRPEKRKSKDESPSPVNVNGTSQSNSTTGNSNSQPTKKPKNLTSPCAISPVLIECPEQDCSKKYKHANGLKYHQSHAHGIVTTDEDSSQPPESPGRIAPPVSPSATSANVSGTSTTNNSQSSTSSNNPPQNAITSSSDSSQNSTTGPQSTVQANNNQTNNTNTKNESSTITANTTSTNSNPPLSSAPTNESGGPIALVPGAPFPTSQSPSIIEKASNAVDPLAPSLPPTTLQQLSDGGKSLSNISAENLNLQQPSGSITTTPTRPTDPQAKVKPGVLRFGPLPDAQQTPNLNNTQGKTPVNPMPDQAIYPPTVGPNSSSALANSNKAQNLVSKQKKNRRSPGPGDFDSSMSNKDDDRRSPAYSDISDDSTTVADSDLNGESF